MVELVHIKNDKMALLLPRSVFFHCTRTAGYWVRDAIRDSGIPTNEVCQLGPRHPVPVRSYYLHQTPKLIKLQDKKSFTFVRHPVTWLRSYWRYKKQNGWNDEPHINTNFLIDKMCQSDDFNTFIDNYLLRLPGYVSTLMTKYTNVHYIGRMENIEENLIEILEKIGEEFDKTKINSAIRNPSHKFQERYMAEYTSKQMKAVIASEDKIISKYYPSSDQTLQ